MVGGGLGSDNILGQEGNDILAGDPGHKAWDDNYSGGDGNDVFFAANRPAGKDVVVSEMVQEVLSRQARAHIQRTGQSHASVRAAVIQTPAGWQLEGLRSSPRAAEGSVLLVALKVALS